jgi:RimJ/RimL family protein N-acetyltransferase
MVGYPKETTLKDGTKLILRKIGVEDVDKSYEFFKNLPQEDRQYLRVDVLDKEQIKLRMDPGPFDWCWRIVAEKDNKIYADATVRSPVTGWMRHTSEIRCIIHPDFKRKGLGSLLIWELFQKTLAEKSHMVFCDVMPEQKAAIAVLERLGFKLSMIRPNHVKDISGNKHDLYIYTKNVQEMWDTLKSYMDEYDFDISIRH